MNGYTKLFSSIITSTVWREPKEVKILWITMLALADKYGEVAGSVPGLAAMAGLGVEETRAALLALESPDADSRTKDEEGRRVKPIDGGWSLINHAKYREMMNADDRKEYLRKKQAEYREKKAKRDAANNVAIPVTDVSDMSTPSTHADSRVQNHTSEPIQRRAAPERARDPLFDALAEACGSVVTQMTKSALRSCGVALAEIKGASPDVTPDEIRRRAGNYRVQFEGAILTPSALAKHWGSMGNTSATGSQPVEFLNGDVWDRIIAAGKTPAPHLRRRPDPTYSLSSEPQK